MPEKLKRHFEREYEEKGLSKSKADSIFYGFEAKRGHHYKRKGKHLADKFTAWKER